MALSYDRQILAPRSDGASEVTGHGAGRLGKMGQVVDRPGRQVLLEPDRTELRVDAALLEVGGAEVQAAEFAQTLGAAIGKLVEKFFEAAVCAATDMSLPIEGRKRGGVSTREDLLRPRDPVRLFSVD